MNDRFVSFLHTARWACALVALAYHIRFLLFVDYGAVQEKTVFTTVFYFVTGLGHDAYAVFFVLDGMLAGRLLLRPRAAGPAHDAVMRHGAARYRLLLPGLALGACLDILGVRFANGAGLYTDFPELSTVTLSGSALLGNLLMLQPFGTPTFGSNSMLYLVAYLFWYAVLLAAFLRAPTFGRHGTALARSAAGAALLLVLLLVLVLPGEFLLWGAIWLCGVAVVLAGEAGRLRPPVVLAAAGLAGALVLSRLVGADAGVLPQPYGHWLEETRYWIVGAAFALLARALYPNRRGHPVRPDAGLAAFGDQVASFTFFFHFPVMMLLVGIGADAMARPLMQQPGPAGYLAFAGVAAASVAVSALVMRATGAAATVRFARV